jgi:DNA-binding GntR family transcriptional regulator
VGKNQYENQTLQESVYEILRDNILTGKLPPNAPLNTSELSKKMHVSRTPVRDAVNKLILIGLAVKVGNKGARVADFMSDEMYEIFSARAYLEGIAARSAAKYMGAEEKEGLLEFAAAFERLYLSGDDKAFMELDEEFHFVIYKSLKNVLIKDMVEQLYIISRRNREVGYHIEGRSQQVVDEHRELVLAIYQGDEKAAERAGICHHSNTILKLKKKFEQLKQENVNSKYSKQE